MRVRNTLYALPRCTPARQGVKRVADTHLLQHERYFGVVVFMVLFLLRIDVSIASSRKGRLKVSSDVEFNYLWGAEAESNSANFRFHSTALSAWLVCS